MRAQFIQGQPIKYVYQLLKRNQVLNDLAKALGTKVYTTLEEKEIKERT